MNSPFFQYRFNIQVTTFALTMHFHFLLSKSKLTHNLSHLVLYVKTHITFTHFNHNTMFTPKSKDRVKHNHIHLTDIVLSLKTLIHKKAGGHCSCKDTHLISPVSTKILWLLVSISNYK